MIDFASALGTLVRGNVEFILVGGAAATAHGSARLTQDIDIVYRRTDENILRLATTSLGDLDLLGEITGGGGYEALVSHSIRLELFGVSCAWGWRSSST